MRAQEDSDFTIYCILLHLVFCLNIIKKKTSIYIYIFHTGLMKQTKIDSSDNDSSILY